MQPGYDYGYDPDPPGQARSHGLRRLSRLTWRATQLSALATVGFAVLFARTAPAATTGSHPAPEATARPSLSGSPSPSPSPSAHRHRRRHHRHPPAATAPSTPPSAAAPAPSQSLAPPTTPPAPPPSPAPSPQTTSSPSHGGG